MTKRSLFLRLISLIVSFSLVFSPLSQSLIYAQYQDYGSTDYSNYQADFTSYNQDIPQAQVSAADIPQETSVQQQIASDPNQTIPEQQDQVVYYDDLLTSQQQDELTNQAREEYQQQITDQPVVDQNSQQQIINDYLTSTQTAADRLDQEYARERGLPDAQALGATQNLVSALERGQQIPDEFWQDWSSKLGDLSDGALDLVTSQVREAQEKGEQQKAQEELAQIEAAAAQQQEKVAQALDQWSGMPALERAETLREYYNLPPGTDPEQVLSFADKAMTLGGVEFRSGPQASTVGPYGVHLNTDLSSFIITEPPKSTSEYLSVPTPDLVGIVQGAIETGKDLYELYQSMPPERAVEVYFSLSPEARDKVNEAMLNGTKEIAGAAVQMVPFVGTNILSERVNGLNGSMAQIAEQLKDPNLTPEEREALKQEYFSSLNEIQDVKKDLVINAAFDLVGGVPGSALAERAAGKGSLAAKELFLDTKAALAAAKQAGKEGLEGVWVGGRQLAADERGSWDVFGLFGKEGKGTSQIIEGGARETETVLKDIDSSLISKASDELVAVEAERRASGELIYSSDFRPSADILTEAVFGVTDPQVADQLAQLMFDGKTPEKLVEVLKQADELVVALNKSGGSVAGLPPEMRSVWDSLKYEAKDVLNKITDDRFLMPGQTPEGLVRSDRAEIAKELLDRERYMVRIGEQIEIAKGPLDNFIEREIANGANPTDLTPVDEVLDPNVFHLIDESNWPKDPDFAQAGGVTYWSDNNIIIRMGSKKGEQFGVTCHEACHRASNLGNPSSSDELYKLFGAENTDKLIEGGTEHLTIKVAEQSGNRAVGSFDPQVEMMTKIEGELVNAGISPEKASAMMTTGEWGGKWDKVIETLGKDRMKEILDAAPSVVRNTSAERFVSPADIDQARRQAERELEAINQANRSGSSNFKENKLSFLITDAYAQEDVGGKATNLDSNAFESLVRKNLAKDTLKEDGKINNRYIQELLETDVLSQLPRQTASGYELVTGKSGAIEGNFGVGQYLVGIDQLPELDIKVPSFIEVKAGTTIVPVAIREGSGKVEKVSAIRSKGGIDVYAQDLPAGRQGEDLPKVQVAAFYDENGNGNWDGSEKALPWAGIQVSLTKVNQEKTVSILPGWNLITLTALPTTPLTASSLLGQIAKQGGYATTVSKLEDGSWKSYVIRGDNTFSGDDFPIEPGQAYFVKNLKRALLTFEGQEFATPVKVNLASGWNAVGFPKTAGEYTVSTLIDELNTQQAGADAASRWESGLWDSFVKTGESYGENFAIEPNRGYIVRLKKGVQLTP